MGRESLDSVLGSGVRVIGKSQAKETWECEGEEFEFAVVDRSG